jgi:hypothetical protein
MPSSKSIPDASVICVALGSCQKWCSEQRVITCYLSEHYKKSPSRVRGKPQNYHCNRGFAIEEMDCLDPAVFKKMIQDDTTVFAKLLEIINLHRVQCMPIPYDASYSLPFAGAAFPSA